MGVFTAFFLFIFLVIQVTGKECPLLYLRYSSAHTYCKPDNPSCKILRSSVSQKDIEVILREHNAYRNRVATGKASNLPTAANMMQMVWDKELAAVAQKLANQCLSDHDCDNCRRVQNYGVGQNLAGETVPNSPNLPDPDWADAIKRWFDEIEYFRPSLIEPFVFPPSKPTYGHFSQVVWAESWRIGCGYVLYPEGNTYEKHYVCNYGPGGNMRGESMYKAGPTCSGCPTNACCGPSCDAKYPGLCKITDDRGPIYKPQGSYIFYCDFQNQPDCDSYVEGPNKWSVYSTMSGNYLGITLKGGEESTMVFKNSIKPSTSSFCVVINFRKGPNLDGQEEDHTANEIFTIKSNNYEVKKVLPTFDADLKHQFSQYSMGLGWNMETKYKVKFSVPAGKPEQFLEIKNIYAVEGKCPK